MDQPLNPYEPPKALAGDGASFEESYEIPSRWRRWFGFAIDRILFVALGFLIGIVAGVLGYGKLLASLLRSEWQALLFNLAISGFYYFLLESTAHQTIGKMVLGMEVVTSDGRRPSTLQILGRTFARVIPFDVLFIFGRERACLHDSASGTRVVRVYRGSSGPKAIAIQGLRPDEPAA